LLALMLSVCHTPVAVAEAGGNILYSCIKLASETRATAYFAVV
jgi:hypothetical protein